MGWVPPTMSCTSTKPCIRVSLDGCEVNQTCGLRHSSMRRDTHADAVDESLPTQTRQHADRVAFAATHIGILSINDRVTHLNFHFVGAGRDVQYLRVIVGRSGLSGLQAIYEYHRTRRRTGHDDLGWIRRLH